MSTVKTSRLPVAVPVERARDPRVYHPLDRLRGTIRRYVLIEGAITAFLLLAVWFAVGLALDFGLFKVSGWDWALDASRGLRVAALIAAVAVFVAFLVFRVVRRVTKDFSYPALALVLERKFPHILGDRLITAVEMADVEAMGQFGYSKEMIHATIAEARERVAKVPVNEVFDWRRLWVMGFLAVALLLGTVAAALASHAVATRAASPYRFGWKFAHVTGIFLERNVALMNTPWPRRAHVELIGLPEGESTVSRDVAAVPITARAYKWVIADRGRTEGWRPMMWSDVTEDLIDRPVPAFDFAALRYPDEPAGSLPGTAVEWTVDSVERRASVPAGEADDTPAVAAHRAALRAALGDRFDELQEVFAALNATAEQPSMGRTLRRLELTRAVTRTDENGNKYQAEEPLKLEFTYRGLRYKGNGDLKGPSQNNEYTGDVSGLREDVNFSVTADDYRTLPRRIRLIPPPSLNRLYRVQSEPAYLHHAPPRGANFEDLKGKRQLTAARNLTLTGERSVFAVPANTEVVIVADASTDDTGAVSENDRIAVATATPVSGRFPGMVLDDAGAATQTPVPLEITEGGTGFRIAFQDNSGKIPPLDSAKLGGPPARRALATVLHGAAKAAVDLRLKGNVEFKVRFENKYGVATTRAVLIQVAQDQPPVVEVGVDVIRKSGNVYLVTPKARIPFNPDSFVKDDHGLSKVEYVFNYYAEDSDVVRGLRTKYALRSLLDAPASGPQYLPALVLPRLHADNFRALDKADNQKTGSVFVSEFVNQGAKLHQDTKEKLNELLAQPLAEGTKSAAVTKIELKDAGRDYFDLKELNEPNKDGIRVLEIIAAPGELQPTYRMDLYVQATDTNADHDGGPRVTRSAEPIRLRIISDADLLAEISKEEEQLGTRLDEALVKLAAAKRKYDYVRTSNGYKEESPAQVTNVQVSNNDATQDVDKARDIVQNVLREFQRIARECQINRVSDDATNNYLRYCGRIEAILSEDPQAAVAFPKTLGMLNGVQAILNAGRWAPLAQVTDAEQSLYALERELAAIRSELGKSITKKDLISGLEELIKKQEAVRQVVVTMNEEWEVNARSPNPQIGAIGAVALTKGETKRLEHKLEWRQYKEDELVVKVAASDPSLVVPAELKLNFEDHQFRFGYEVKAGANEGTYKITLTPAVGKPVEVTVVVK